MSEVLIKVNLMPTGVSLGTQIPSKARDHSRQWPPHTVLGTCYTADDFV